MIFILWRKTKSGRTHILLAGLSDAGKTALFSQLLFSEDKETFSSITANVADFVEASEQVCAYYTSHSHHCARYSRVLI